MTELKAVDINSAISEETECVEFWDKHNEYVDFSDRTINQAIDQLIELRRFVLNKFPEFVDARFNSGTYVDGYVEGLRLETRPEKEKQLHKKRKRLEKIKKEMQELEEELG